MLKLENRISLMLVNSSAILGIAAAVVALFQASQKGQFTLTVGIYALCFLLLNLPKIYMYIQNLKFREYPEDKFINSLDFTKIKKIKILSHTGRLLFSKIGEKIDKLKKENKKIPNEIHVLTRTNLVESTDRYNYIISVISQVSNFRKYKNISPHGVGDEKIDIRFYEAIPSIRGLICEDYSGNKLYFTSAYHWPKDNESKKIDYSFIVKEKKNQNKPQSQLLQSWFRQYWGKDEIHTIVFDFDDTLIPSMQVQVDAWVRVINNRMKSDDNFQNKLHQRLKKHLSKNDEELMNNKKFCTEVKKIFIEHQLAEAIIDEIFIDITEKDIEELNNERFEIRKKFLLKGDVELFPGVNRKLEDLSKFHNFAIITSTDENMVKKYLTEKKLINFFGVILGKNDPLLRYERENIHKKANLLIKLSEIIGTPLDRMVYVGDNSSDYLATRQIGIDFIEARLAAIKIKKTTLLNSKDIKKKRPIGSFESYETNELNEILKERSIFKKNEKY